LSKIKSQTETSTLIASCFKIWSQERINFWNAGLEITRSCLRVVKLIQGGLGEMIRILTLVVLIMGTMEVLISSFVLSTWIRISEERNIKPALAIIAILFLNLGFWNYAKGNYLLSTTASLFFFISLTFFMMTPISETWKKLQEMA